MTPVQLDVLRALGRWTHEGAITPAELADYMRRTWHSVSYSTVRSKLVALTYKGLVERYDGMYRLTQAGRDALREGRG